MQSNIQKIRLYPLSNTLFFIVLFQFYNFLSHSAGINAGVVAGQQYLYTNLMVFTPTGSSLPVDYTMNNLHPFTNGFLASNNNYRAQTCLAGMHLIQNQSNFRYLKLYPNSKTTTSMTVSLRINKTQYFVYVTTYLIVIDQLYDNSISITTYYLQLQTIINSTLSYSTFKILPISVNNTGNCLVRPYTSLVQLKSANGMNAFGYVVTLTLTTVNNVTIDFSSQSPFDTYIKQVQLNIFVIDYHLKKASNSFYNFALNSATGGVYSSYGYAMYATSLFGGLTQILHNTDVAGSFLYFNLSITDGANIQLGISTGVDKASLQMIIFCSVGCSSPNPYFYSVDLKCYDVCPSTTIQNQSIKQCIFKIDYCQTVVVNKCALCKTSFTQGANNLTCDCPGGQIITSTCINMPGCLNAQVILGVSTCLFCDFSKGLILVSNVCICKDGFVNSSITSSCQEICGDGKLYTDQCDDGNTYDGDGCSSNCTLETGFYCTSSSVGATIATSCRVQINIGLYLISTIKSPQQNSATITFGIRNSLPHLPLIFLMDSIVTNLSSAIVFTKLESSSNQIILTFNYLKTVQSLPIKFDFDFSNTSYISNDFELNFLLKGDQLPLKYTNFQETYNNVQKVNYLNGFVGLLVLLIALPAPKFIGVETIETLQLFFYSLLLIPMKLWTAAFQTLLPLKYCNGYTVDLFKQNDYKFLTQNQNALNKFQTLEFSYMFLNNMNVMLGIFFVMFAVFLIYSVYQKSIEKTLLEPQTKQKKTAQNQQIKQKYLQLIEKSQKLYKILLHFAFFILLSVMAGIYIEIASPIELQSTAQNTQLYTFQSINIFLIALTFICLVSIFFNNFFNLFLTDVRLKTVQYRYRNKQLLHVKLNLVYILTMAILIIFINNEKLIPSGVLSVFVLIVELAYIALLLVVKPYQFCVRIHSFALFFNHANLIVLFIFINIFNFFQITNELFDVIFVYYVLGACFLVSVFTIVRLYYQYRYGNQLDQKVKKEDEKRHQNQLLQAKIKQEKQIAERIKRYQIEAKQKSMIQGPNPNKNWLISKKNKFLYKNQMDEDQQMDLLQWLQKRINWTHQQKEKYYFSKFSQKPLAWLKKYDIQKYNKRIQKLEKEKTIKEDPEELIQIKQKLKDDLLKKRNIMKINDIK